MTQYPTTRTAVAASPSSGGVDIKTLAITAAASAGAAFVCSRVWASGTLAAAAFTPVLVAILREALNKSTEVVVKAVPVRGVVRSAHPEGPQPADAAWSADASPLRDEDPAQRVPRQGEIAYHRTGGSARRWRIAIVTGLLGFLIAAVLFTVPELVAGRSASGGASDTTLFGGKQRESSTPATTTTTTTPTKTVTTAPEQTVTVPPQTVTTPAPATTTPAPGPQTTTPVPTTTPAPRPVQPPPAEIPPG